MKLYKCYMTQSTWYKGAGNRTPHGVLWHSTGVNNPNLKRYVQPDDNAADKQELLKLLGTNTNRNDWNHIYREAGVHAWIGKLADGTIATVEAGPHEKKAWGCGAAANKLKNGWSLNETHIQFEICEGDLSDKTYFNKIYKEALEYTAMLCKKYGWDPMGTFLYKGENIPVITDHAGSNKIGHGGNHGDVGHWFIRYLGNNYLSVIRKDVRDMMNNINKEETEKKEEIKEETTQTPFLIKVDATKIGEDNVLNIRKEPNAASQIVGGLWYDDKNTYTIIDTENGWGKLKSGIGWVNLYYTKDAATTKPVYKIHTVKHGDTLWKIAQKYLGDGNRHPEIKKLNNLSSNLLYTGQELKIPNK